MAKLALILSIKKLRQLALAEETEQIGLGTYGEMMKTVEYMKNLQREIITDSDQVKEIEENVFKIEDAIQTYGISARSLRSKFFSNRHGAAAKKQAKSEIASLCEKIKQSPHFVDESYNNNNQQLIMQSSNFVYKHEDIAVVVGMEEEKEIIQDLNEEDSWKLLKNIVCLEMDPGAEVEPATETMGRQIVKLCEGIPGVNVALAKQLEGKSASEWVTVQKNARRYLSQVMARSYAELLDDQKLYFLYLGHFREDAKIEPEKLSHLWKIEGLISLQDCRSKMTFLDITQEQLMILTQKRMIDVRKIVEVIKSCRLVGLMGDMCLSKGEETDFLKVLDLQISTGDDNQPSFSLLETRRLVIYLGKYDARVTPESAPKLWSLRIIQLHDHQQLEEFVWPSIIMSNIKKFKKLRILDFGRVDFRRGELPEGIFGLLFLRYLSFEGCFLTELPSSISNLLYLQVLDLRINDTCNVIIPDVLQKMGWLQHLYLPRAFQPPNKKKLRLDELAELQTLKNLNSKLCEIRDLFKLKKLRNLDAKVEESLEDLKSITDLMKSDQNQKWLCSSIEVKNFDCYTETKHIVFRQLLKSGVPPILSFEGLIGLLPPHNHISQSFTEIVLRSTQLKEDPMATLENLAKLRLLVLDDDAFLGEKMVCSASGFPELEHLELSSLFKFKEWRVEKGAMQRLSYLKIENCKILETFPDSSEFVTPHLEFEMRTMPEPFEQRVRERFQNAKHIRLL